jgi:hypothetical protein
MTTNKKPLVVKEPLDSALVKFFVFIILMGVIQFFTGA